MSVIPNSDHVARYYSKRKANDDGTPSSIAFHIRKKSDGTIENGLSVDWLEFHSIDPATALLAICKGLKSRLTVSKNDRLAILQIEKTKKHLHGTCTLEFIHDGKKSSHSLVKGYRSDDAVIEVMIAQTVLYNVSAY